MQIESDSNLSLSSRTFRWKGGEHVSVSAMSAFSIGEDGRAALLPETELWPMAGPVLEQGLALEEGFPKPGREFFVSGSAYAPQGKMAEAVKVSASVGDLRRDLRVTGDRQWGIGNTMSSPEPFSEKPLDWQYASGGPDNPANPLGKTGAPDPKTGKTPLPNILDAKDIPLGPDKSPPPASMLPKGSAWASRADVPAVLSGKWPENVKPGEFPDQFNWEWFHAADPAQRGKGKFQPGESFSVSGMHPEKPVVSGSLPTETPWARIERFTEAGELQTSMIQLQPDTVWLFPGEEKGVVVWHGTAPLSGTAAEDAMTLRGGYGEQPATVEAPVKVEALPSAPPEAPPLPAPPEVAAVAVEAEAPLKKMAAERLDEELAAATIAAPMDEGFAAVGATMDEELATISAPAPEPEKTVRAAVPKTEKERADEVREAFREAFDNIAAADEMNETGDLLDLFNKLAASRGFEPITEEVYHAYLPEYFDKQLALIEELPDEVLSLMNEDEPEITEEEAISVIREKLIDIGVDEDTAAELAATAYDEPTEAELAKGDELLAELAKLNLGDGGISLEELQSGEIDTDAAQAKLDELAREQFGKSFDEVMSMDDDSIPVPDSKESFLSMISATEDELPEEVNALLSALFDDVDDEGFDDLMSQASEAYAMAMEYIKAKEAEEEQEKGPEAPEAEKKTESEESAGLKTTQATAETKIETKAEAKTEAEIKAEAEASEDEDEKYEKLVTADDVEMERLKLEKLETVEKDDAEKSGDPLLEKLKDKLDDAGNGEPPDDIFGDAMK